MVCELQLGVFSETGTGSWLASLILFCLDWRWKLKKRFDGKMMAFGFPTCSFSTVIVYYY
ncbi:hypothetical protein SCLCIDRAFT_33336 [Scleroderma citrinum Foug A]|uniref:Uncharacterized protein n=1 Tax=Scleroderma citrinum Foug A TaxID=1036808 RepID=A0A0C3CSP9_9AGAM|nr:hypothetical protein SCLCIDRAFT_33336 [Scleroderma citrinum Foug A]